MKIEKKLEVKFSSVIEQLSTLYSPTLIVLFGSQAKGNYREQSDVDICIVADVENKRKTLADMYYNVDYDKPIDFLLYTSKEWEKNLQDKNSFAYKINNEGVYLYGRQ